MESTGYYWIPLFWMLQSYGFEVMVVNPTDVKRYNRPKTDVLDACWLQQLHALGLLKSSFQMDNFGEMLRSYVRRRRNILQDRTRQMNRMHKVLILMNVQIGTQLTDLGGAVVLEEEVVGGGAEDVASGGGVAVVGLPSASPLHPARTAARPRPMIAVAVGERVMVLLLLDGGSGVVEAGGVGEGGEQVFGLGLEREVELVHDRAHPVDGFAAGGDVAGFVAG